ncbi:PD-(D/E)XK nuclease family protein [Flavobacteriaceae bacterium]|nr:PD-(D/E)XK nuclease family protein [Flavobacteriaceae bacterium]
MEEKIIPVEAIQERDVDLILLEEFTTDNFFCEWFINELDLPKISEKLGVWRSITGYGLGETDILFSYKSESKTSYIMIENKLDASFQNKQYERYLQRAEKYVTDKSCDAAFTVLVALKLFCENQSELVNDLIRQARKQQIKIDWIRTKLEKAENSGFTSETKNEILAQSKTLMNG